MLATSQIWHPFSSLKQTNPLPKVVSGEGVFLTFEDGKKVIDCISSWWVNLHGHSEPTIAEAIAKQAKTLEQVIFAGYTHEPAQELVRLLQSKLPSSLSYFFFSDNGSTAVEVALKIAYQYWKNQGIQTRNCFGRLANSYHGDTLGAMSVSACSYITQTFEDLLQKSYYVNPPVTWQNDAEAEQKMQISLQEVDTLLHEQGERMAAFIVEPLVQGCCGFHMYPPKFLQELKQKLQAYSIPLIFDEVMTGFGRTGRWFALDTADVVPDIMCVSKGITGGFMPLSATICSNKIASVFHTDEVDKIFYHGHSYTANPLACAAGIASFHLLEKTEEKLGLLSQWHQEGLDILLDCEKLSRLRVCGTLAAMDFKTSPDYSAEDRDKLIGAFLKKGYLIRPIGNVLYILPPYVITKEQLLGIYKACKEIINEINI